MADDIYNPSFVRGLFNEMSHTYGVVNVVSSFGFCVRWRRQCVRAAGIRRGFTVCDLMSGCGELWPSIARQLRDGGAIAAVDFSEAMAGLSRPVAGHLRVPVDIRLDDALSSALPDSSADAVVCSFGLKTFNAEQLERLAHEVCRVLKPGGRLSFVEISVPPSAWLRAIYMFYVRQVIPLIGQLFLGNPDNYRLLGIYTASFSNCLQFARLCTGAGLSVRPRSLFFGCATGVVGERPGLS